MKPMGEDEVDVELFICNRSDGRRRAFLLAGLVLRHYTLLPIFMQQQAQFADFGRAT